jgi:beta-1,4-mannosyl-glycoprotein beta-1,4-N-acetylglucosaminyltransferase
MFWKELDMLELRLRHLWDYVDEFVIVEADRTFRGAPKPLFFWENRTQFAWAMPKIKHVVVQMPESHSEYWGMEGLQRDGIMNGIEHALPEDYVFISDVDELPKYDALKKAMQRCQSEGPVALVLSKHHWKLNNRMDVTIPGSEFHYPWASFTVCQRKHLRLTSQPLTMGWTPQVVRDKRCAWPQEQDGGWHFSFIGDEYFNKEKIEAFSHSEYDLPDFTNPDKIKERIEKLDVDPFERGFRYRVEPIVKGEYPDEIVNNIEKYTNLGWIAKS